MQNAWGEPLTSCQEAGKEKALKQKPGSGPLKRTHLSCNEAWGRDCGTRDCGACACLAEQLYQQMAVPEVSLLKETTTAVLLVGTKLAYPDVLRCISFSIPVRRRKRQDL